MMNGFVAALTTRMEKHLPHVPKTRLSLFGKWITGNKFTDCMVMNTWWSKCAMYLISWPKTSMIRVRRKVFSN